MQNNRKAFSLIEAMVILLLISVAVMALIPLMTKSSSNPRWRLIDDTLAFGTIAKHNVKIGTGSTADTTSDARLKVLGSASFMQTGADGSNNILITDNYDASATEPYTPLTNEANSSIILGVNTCSTTPASSIIDSSIIVGSLANNATCSANTIDIGNNTTNINVDNGGNLTLRTNGIDVLTLNADNNFEIKYPDNDPDKAQGLTYKDGELEIHNGFIVSDGTGTLYLNSYPTIDPDEFNCTDGQTVLTVYSYSAAEAKIKEGYTCTIENDSTEYSSVDKLYQAPGYCNEIIKNDTSNSPTNSPTHSYCHNTKDTWWEFKNQTTSDKRLKNIIADYEKGLENLNKIKTYNFTYKSDKQKRNHVGLIAQHLQNLYDEALHKDEKGYLSYEKEPILYSMINAVKEIFSKQNKIEKQTIKLNKKADKLIRMYRWKKPFH